MEDSSSDLEFLSNGEVDLIDIQHRNRLSVGCWVKIEFLHPLRRGFLKGPRST